MRVYLAIFCLLISSALYAQDWLSSGGGLYNDEAFDVEVDQNGNVFTTGYVTSTATFGANINITTNGYSDIYVSKSDANGNFLWVKVFGGAQADRGYDLELDPQGNVYVTGYFYDVAQFDNVTLTAAGNSRDAFVLKLDQTGSVIWAKSDGGANGDTGYGISVDGQGNVICTGQFKGSATIGASNFVSVNDPNTNLPSFDSYVVKYDPNGNAMWAIQGFAPYDDRGMSIDCDANNNIYVGGQFSDTITFGGFTQNNNILNAGMLIKIDPIGNVVWFQRLAAFQTLVNDVEVDQSDDIWLTGDFLGQMLIIDQSGYNYLNGPYTYRIFALKMDIAGNLIWAQADGSESEITSQAITIDANNDAYLSGMFKCTFTEYADTTDDGQFNSIGFRDIFVTKYSSTGTRQWMHHYGGPRDDFNGGIAISTIDKPIIAGGFDEFFQIPYDNSGFPFQTNQGSVNSGPLCPGSSNNYIKMYATGARDVFIGQPINLNLHPYYYYYGLNCFDTIPACVANCADSLTFCGSGSISANTFTHGNGAYDETEPLSYHNHIGPFFNFLWSNGDTIPSVNGITNSSLYTCEISRVDGCKSYIDSVYVTVNPIPSLPAVNDNFGQNVNQFPSYENIEFCNPDTASIWLSFVDTNLITQITLPNNTSFLDSLPHMSSVGGTVTVSVLDSLGCSNDDDFQIITYDSLSKDTISPYLALVDTIDFNDSITICMNDHVTVSLLDSITNPLGNFLVPFCSVIEMIVWNADTTVIPDVNQPYCAQYQFTPNSTGWYPINCDIALGWENLCGIDTTWYHVRDSFYVEVHPLPQLALSLQGDNLLCPGDTVTVWTDSVVAGFTWNGPAIIQTSIGGDTILANLQGTYTYGGGITDSLTGCSNQINKIFTVSIKPDPFIFANVPDHIICPGDSLLLTCQQSAAQYDWVGPNGNIIGGGQTIWVDVPGLYHCVIIDNDSCVLTSNTLELKEYNTPYLIADPGTEICHTGNIVLTVHHNGTPSFNWLPPISSTANSITVSQAGTYVCEISQCGFVVTDSIVITQSNVTALITALTDTVICPGDTAVLLANSGMVAYQWSVQNETNQSLMVTDTGMYAVTVYDASGCSATSDSINISFHPGSGMPVVASTTICQGDTAFLSNTNGQFTEWYTNMSDTVASSVGPNLIIPNVISDTILYVSSSNGVCTTPKVPVYVNISPASLNLEIGADTSYCSNAIISLSSNANGNINYMWDGPNNFMDSVGNPIIINADTSMSGYYNLTVFDQYCSSAADSILITVHPLTNLTLNYPDTMYKCAYDSVLLVASGNMSYTWLPANAQGDSLFVFTPGDYFVIAQDSNSCLAISDTITVMNFPIQIPAVSDTAICYGDSLILSANNQVVDWYDETGTYILTDSFFQTPVLYQDTIYYAALIDSNACISPLSAIQITVSPASGAPNIYGDTVLCEGENLNLFTDIIPGASYFWNGSQINPSNASNISLSNVSLSDSGYISLQVNGNACITLPHTVFITVNPNPPNVLITGDTIYCENDSLSLYSTSVNTIWLDQFGTVLDTGMILNIYPISVSDSGLIYAIQFDTITECISQASSMNITVHPAPNSTFIMTSGPVCLGNSIQIFTGLAANSNPLWTFPSNATFVGDTVTIDTLDISDQGWYVVEQINNNGCMTIDSFYMQLDSAPQIDLGPDFILCEDSTFTIQLDTTYDFYLWQDGSNNSSYVITDSGLIVVFVSTLSGCASWDSLQVDLVNCAINVPNALTPNNDGKNDYLFIKFLEEPNYLIIKNRWGRTVFETVNYQNDWNGIDQEAGVYYYILYPFGKEAIDQKPIKGFFHLFK